MQDKNQNMSVDKVDILEKVLRLARIDLEL